MPKMNRLIAASCLAILIGFFVAFWFIVAHDDSKNQNDLLSTQKITITLLPDSSYPCKYTSRTDLLSNDDKNDVQKVYHYQCGSDLTLSTQGDSK